MNEILPIYILMGFAIALNADMSLPRKLFVFIFYPIIIIVSLYTKLRGEER